MAEDIINDPAPQDDPKPTPSVDPKADPAPPQEPTLELNYEELLKTDKALQSLIDKERTKAAQTAREKEAQRLKIITDEKISEKAKFEAMTKDEQIAELARKNALLEEKYEREKAADSLRRTVEEQFAAKGIPPAMSGLIDFLITPADRCKEIEEMLSDFEYYPKGELDRRVSEEVDKRLKQKAPENHAPNGKRDYAAELAKARKDKNQILAIQIKQEAHKAGIVLQ